MLRQIARTLGLLAAELTNTELWLGILLATDVPWAGEPPSHRI